MKDNYRTNIKQQKNKDYLDITYKKSPKKQTYYQQYDINNPYLKPSYQTNVTQKQFYNVRKLSQDTSMLRQTMNFKTIDDIRKKTMMQQQQEKQNKLNDFLRKTVSYKSIQSIYSNYEKQEEKYKKNEQKTLQYVNKRPEALKIGQSRSSINLIDPTKNSKTFQLYSDKFKKYQKQKQSDQKNQTTQYTEIKSASNIRSPNNLNSTKTYEEQNGFKKKKMQSPETQTVYTPKLDKGKYQNRFDSSPLALSAVRSQKQRLDISPSLHFSTKFKMSTVTESMSSPVFKKRLTMQQFQIGKKLGEGKFGSVSIARHKSTSGLFALKKIPKSLIKSHMMIDQLSLQIRIQSCLNHRNILGMYGFFDDSTHFYIVLQYMDGGTLYQRLKKQKIMSETDTAKVIKQITQSIQYLHDIGIAHRDIKPQNIVISNNVYKLCDFGWAAFCDEERRKTYCGTFDYVAPEILEGSQYDMTVDLWCLGVLAYELMVGKAPFYHISRKETMKKILNVQNENIIYPPTMSQRAKDFIQQLVKKNPQQRLKAQDALSHPFLKNIQNDI